MLTFDQQPTGGILALIKVMILYEILLIIEYLSNRLISVIRDANKDEQRPGEQTEKVTHVSEKLSWIDLFQLYLCRG